MKPGDTRTFKKGQGKAVVLAVGLWAERRTAKGPIHIHIAGTRKGHTTVTDQLGSQRHHRTLFRDLRRVLIEHGSWPYGD